MKIDDRHQRRDVREYLQVLYGRKGMIISIFLVVIVCAAFQSYTTPKVYRAQTRLIFEKTTPTMSTGFDPYGYGYYNDLRFFETQVRLIESRAVASEVIRRLNLTENQEFLSKSSDDVLSAAKRFVFSLPRKAIGGVISLLRGTTHAPEKSQDDGENGISPGFVSAFISLVSVSQIKNSNLIDIGFQARNPKLAATIVNMLAQVYIDKGMETRLTAVRQAMSWLNDEIEKEREKVDTAEQALLAYKQKNNIITGFSNDVETITAQKLFSLNQQVVEAEADRVEAQTRYEGAVMLKNSPLNVNSMPKFGQDNLIEQIKKTEVELYQQISEMAEKYGRKHPKMVAVQSELNEIQKRKALEITRIIDSLRNEYKIALARELSLKNALEEQKKEVMQLNEKAIEYSVLQREAEATRQMYEVLIKRFKETSVSEDIRSSGIRILDKAEVPQSPILPNPRRSITIAAIVGLMLGFGAALVLEFLDQTVKSSDDSEKVLGLPCLGLIPFVPFRNRQDPSVSPSRELLVTEGGPPQIGEIFRTLRTKILFSRAEGRPRIILVTSAIPGEGKTLISANLSAVMAQAEKPVLVVDCDMRRPRLHDVFEVAREPGLTNLLVGECSVEEAIRKTMVPGLDILPSGHLPPNPAELLGSSKMADTLSAFLSDYMSVVLDTPPLATVTDALLLARISDMTILVLSAHRVTHKTALHALNLLQSVGVHASGSLLNGVDVDRGGYYYRHYDYPLYHSYYSDYSSEDAVGKEPKRGPFWRRLANLYTSSKRPS